MGSDKQFDTTVMPGVAYGQLQDNTPDEKAAAIRLVHKNVHEPEDILEILGLATIKER